MNASPIILTLYDENDEIKATYQKLVIPWGMLKRSLKFKDLNENAMDDKAFDTIGGYVCELFCNKFTLSDLEAGADITEVFSVIQAVVARAGGYFPNQQAGK
jgi:hypothetical protein